MNSIRDRLLHKIELLPSVFPDRQVAEDVAERVAEWLEAAEPTPVCTVRSGRTLVIASKQDGKLQLTISQTLMQLEDSALFRKGQAGFSVLAPGVPSTIVEIPLSEISRSE
jgi:septum formation inhibitor MinC